MEPALFGFNIRITVETTAFNWVEMRQKKTEQRKGFYMSLTPGGVSI